MSKFNKDYFFSKNKSIISDIIIDILDVYNIALSTKLESEWKSTCGSQPFIDWINYNILSKKIVMVDHPYLDPSSIKVIYNKFGLPRKGKDMELIKIANVTITKYILTNDIHLFEPKAKSYNSTKKNKIKNDRIGALNKYLYKNLNILVGLYCHCCDDLKLYYKSFFSLMDSIEK